ncbi:TPA: hypothetical protein ACGOXG_000374 [Streptococcus suis]
MKQRPIKSDKSKNILMQILIGVGVILIIACLSAVFSFEKIPNDIFPLDIKSETGYNLLKNIFKIFTQGEVIVGIVVAIPTINLWSSELQNRKLDRRVSDFEYSFRINKELRQAQDRCKKLVQEKRHIIKKDRIKQLILEVSAYVDLLEQIQQYKDRELIITTISNSDIYKSLLDLQCLILKNKTNEKLVEEIGGVLTRLLIYDKDDIKLKGKDPIEGIYFLFDHSEFICLNFKEVFEKEKIGWFQRDEEDPMFLFKNSSRFRKCKIDIKTFSKFARIDEEIELGEPVFESCEFYIGNKRLSTSTDFKESIHSEKMDDKYYDAIIKDLEGRA